MNKTTTRLATIGGAVLLGAFAIALAQNDARQRDRDQPLITPPTAQQAIPIPAEENPESWSPATKALTSRLIVRGNNDRAEEFSTSPLPESAKLENPLRHAVAAEPAGESGQVVLAAAGVPIEPSLAGRPSTNAPSTHTPGSNTPGTGSPSTGSPPSWLGAADAQAALAAPPPATPAGLPTLPAFPGDSPLGGASLPVPPTAQGLPSSGNPYEATPASPRVASPRVPSAAAAEPPPALPGIPVASFDTAAMASAPSQTGGAADLLSAVSSPTSSSPSADDQTHNSRIYSSQEPETPAVGSQLNPVQAMSNRVSMLGNQPAAAANLVSNQPGNRYLDGSQNPNLLIQKRAPEEIMVGKQATFAIAVRNAGNATAHEVRVLDSVPRGSRFVDATPPATPDAQGMLTWNLGEMAAGDERTITLQIVPEVQGEVGSNAVVYFGAQASVRTVATLPKLELQVQSLPEMLIGGRQTLSLLVENSGTGMAREVRLEVDLPPSLKHDIGEAQLAAPLGNMRPNETRPITLDITAVGPGQAPIVFRALNDDGAVAEQQLAVQVLAPQLSATISGPALRYLDRQANFMIQIANQGTTAATNLEFIAHLPPGMKFVSTSQKGFYDPALHAVRWALYELPKQVTAPIELALLPVEAGQQSISFMATGDLGLKTEAKHTVSVDGLAELAFTIGQNKRTIETGTSSTYWVQVTNVGNKPDRDVRLTVNLPAGSVLKAIDAQVKYRTDGNQIVFDAVPEMRNKDQITYRFEIQHNQPGTQIVRTQLTSANWPVAVIKEEGTLVYNDQN